MFLSNSSNITANLILLPTSMSSVSLPNLSIGKKVIRLTFVVQAGVVSSNLLPQLNGSSIPSVQVLLRVERHRKQLLQLVGKKCSAVGHGAMRSNSMI